MYCLLRQCMYKMLRFFYISEHVLCQFIITCTVEIICTFAFKFTKVQNVTTVKSEIVSFSPTSRWSSDHLLPLPRVLLHPHPLLLQGSPGLLLLQQYQLVHLKVPACKTAGGKLFIAYKDMMLVGGVGDGGWEFAGASRRRPWLSVISSSTFSISSGTCVLSSVSFRVLSKAWYLGEKKAMRKHQKLK